MTSTVGFELSVRIVRDSSRAARRRCKRLARSAAVSSEALPAGLPSLAVALPATSSMEWRLQRRTLHPRLRVYSDPSAASCCSLTRAAAHRSSGAAGVLRDRHRHETELAAPASRAELLSALNALRYLSAGLTAAAGRAAPEWRSAASWQSGVSCQWWPRRCRVQCISQVLFVWWRTGHSWRESTRVVSSARRWTCPPTAPCLAWTSLHSSTTIGLCRPPRHSVEASASGKIRCRATRNAPRPRDSELLLWDLKQRGRGKKKLNKVSNRIKISLRQFPWWGRIRALLPLSERNKTFKWLNHSRSYRGWLDSIKANCIWITKVAGH